MSVLLGPNVEPIPGYRLIERLGRGGFGEVWKAEAPGGLHKAIKFVFGDLNSAGEGAPAEQERRSLERIKSIRHPYILSLERIEEVDGQLVIVMELADRNLWDRFRDCRAEGLQGIPRDELLPYMKETAEALDLMNIRHQLQHLDIKPQNLFLVYNHIKVADFGLVKELRGEVSRMTGGVTPVYAAPETFNGYVSQQSDQYSLAIVYQELLTGHRPFNGSNAYQLLSQHVSKPPDVSFLPVHDRPHISKALSKQAEHRFSSCTELINALCNADRESARSVNVPKRAPDLGTDASALSTPTDALSPTTPDRPATMQIRRAAGAAPSTQIQPRQSEADSRCGNLAVAVSESSEQVSHTAVETASLIPSVVIGVGGVGLQVLQRLRFAIQSQFGDTNLPHLRMMAVDTDANDLRKLTSDSNCLFRSEELYHAGLHRASHYLKSDSAVAIDAWLGSQTLYKLPRNPTSANSRAFGRLAFFDHAIPLAKRLKGDIEACRQPSALEASTRATGIEFRSSRPRVYVVAGLGGGTGSGMTVDLAYLARHVLRELGETVLDVVAVLLLPQADANGKTQPAVLNAIAALTELNHFSSSQTRYECRVNSKFGIPTDTERPFRRCAFLPFDDPMDGAAAAQSAGEIAAILCRDLISPLGAAADEQRADYASYDPPIGIDAQTMSVYRLAWPGRLLRQRAAHGLALDLIRNWTARDVEHLKEPVSQWVESQWDSRRLNPEGIAERFHQAATAELGSEPASKIESIIGSLIEATTKRNEIDEAACCKALDDVVHYLGPANGNAIVGQSSTLPELFEKVTPDIIRQCDQHLAALAAHFVEEPGYRIGAAEEAIREISNRARQALGTYESLAASLSQEAVQLFRSVLAAILAVGKAPGVGDKLTRGSKRRDQQNQDFFELLRSYAKKHYQALLAKELTFVYRGMVGSVPEYLHDVNQCRLRLAEIEKTFVAKMESDTNSEPPLGKCKHLFADSASSLGEAARLAISGLSQEERDEFDRVVQVRVRKLFRTLVSFCLDAGPRAEILTDAIDTAAQEFIASRISNLSSLDVFLSEYEGEAAAAILREVYDDAHPPLAGPRSRLEAMSAIIAAPNGEPGKQFRQCANDVFASENVTFTESAEEILVYRELRRLEMGDLPHFNAALREAFESARTKSEQVLHSRTDIEWLPVP